MPTIPPHTLQAPFERTSPSCFRGSGVRVNQSYPRQGCGLRFNITTTIPPGCIAAQARRAKRKRFADLKKLLLTIFVCKFIGVTCFRPLLVRLFFILVVAALIDWIAEH